MNRKDFMEMYSLAMSLYKDKQYDKALNVIGKYEKIHNVHTLQGSLLRCAILRDMGKYPEEIALLNDLRIEFETVDDPKGLTELHTMLGEAYKWQGDNNNSIANYLQAAILAPNPKRKIQAIGSVLFAVNAMVNISAEEMQALYALYRENIVKLDVQAYPAPQWKHEKIRIGYLSADFCKHAVSQFVRPLLFDFDSSEFEIYVYQINDNVDYVTTELQKAPVYWKNLAHKNIREVAEIIRDDEVDILFDLGGHTKNNMLPVFAYHPARIQISGIGYFNSTGIYECDGFLSDMYCAPNVKSPYFIEKLLRLSHTHFCYQPYTSFPQVVAPPVIKRGYITFGSFNNLAKVNDDVLSLWREILRQVPNGRLLLKHRLMGTEDGKKYVSKRLLKQGLPIERIEMRGLSTDYLSEYGDMDIALDTFPYQGGLTTCEALFMGVPVVTLIGDRHGSRFGFSILSNIGISELAGRNREEYIKIAVALAQNRELLIALRQNLRCMMKKSPLMNGKMYMRDLESLYRHLIVENDSFSGFNLAVDEERRNECMEKRVSIIILNKDLLSCTKQLIESIRQYTQKGSYEIIVVDNGSQDDSVAWLRQQKDVRLICNKDNVGFPKGCNQGMEIAEGDEIMLLNNDTVVTQNWLVNLRKALYSNPVVGAVGPVTNYCSNSQQIDIPYPNENTPEAMAAMQRFAEDYNQSNPKKWHKWMMLVGFCMLFKREVYEKIGAMDEAYSPGNFEDDDYSIRIRKAGYEILLCKDTFIHHFGSKTFLKLSNDSLEKQKKEYDNYMLRNEAYFLQKWKLRKGMYKCYRSILPDLEFADEPMRIIEYEAGSTMDLYILGSLCPQGDIRGTTSHKEDLQIGGSYPLVYAKSIFEFIDILEGEYQLVIISDELGRYGENADYIIKKIENHLSIGGWLITVRDGQWIQMQRM